MAEENTSIESREWEAARKRVTARRDFVTHAVVYLVVNTSFVLVWAATGGGYFWPAWIIAAWGVGLVMNAWDVFLRRPVTDADIRAELRRAEQRDRGNG
jgi:hypothetical protein